MKALGGTRFVPGTEFCFSKTNRHSMLEQHAAENKD